MVVDAEDWLPVSGTYPEHSSRNFVPRVRTLKELKSLRELENKQDIRSKLKPPVCRVPEADTRDETQKKSLQITSIRAQKKEKLARARKACNLTAEPEDPKFARHPPSLTYVKNPHYGSLTDLQNLRKSQNLSDLIKLQAKVGVVKNSEQRV